MRLGNAEALTKFAEKTLCSDSKTSEKIEWLLDEFSSAGNDLSHSELIKKMTDNYVELVKGHFVDMEK